MTINKSVLRRISVQLDPNQAAEFLAETFDADVLKAAANLADPEGKQTERKRGNVALAFVIVIILEFVIFTVLIARLIELS